MTQHVSASFRPFSHFLLFVVLGIECFCRRKTCLSSSTAISNHWIPLGYVLKVKKSKEKTPSPPFHTANRPGTAACQLTAMQ